MVEELGYPHARFLDAPAYTPPAVGSLSPFLSGYQLGDSQLGVALYPGVSEIALASMGRAGRLSYAPLAGERARSMTTTGISRLICFLKPS